jgi:hypothetical protein
MQRIDTSLEHLPVLTGPDIAQRAGSNLQDARCRALSNMPSETESQPSSRQTLVSHLQLCLRRNSLENIRTESIEVQRLARKCRTMRLRPVPRYGHCRGLDRSPSRYCSPGSRARSPAAAVVKGWEWRATPPPCVLLPSHRARARAPAPHFPRHATQLPSAGDARQCRRPASHATPAHVPRRRTDAA